MQAGPTYESTVSYTYDAGNRVIQAVDSVTGTIVRAYDGLNRLTSETTPQGTISYTYDAGSRRQTSTVTGQSAVSYTSTTPAASPRFPREARRYNSLMTMLIGA